MRGLLYFGLIPRRPNDEIGLFGLFGQFSSDLRDVGAREPRARYDA